MIALIVLILGRGTSALYSVCCIFWVLVVISPRFFSPDQVYSSIHSYYYTDITLRFAILIQTFGISVRMSRRFVDRFVFHACSIHNALQQIIHLLYD